MTFWLVWLAIAELFVLMFLAFYLIGKLEKDVKYLSASLSTLAGHVRWLMEREAGLTTQRPANARRGRSGWPFDVDNG